jgi:DNA-binding CsgD family transcriptional regulator/PAS domain-containing protein
VSVGEDGLVRLVGQIYESAGDRTQWPAFLASFRAATRAAAVHIAIDDHANDKGVVTEFLGHDPRFLSMYAEYYSSRDVWVRGRPRLPTGETVLGQRLIRDEDLAKTEFYGDFLRPQGQFHVVAGCIFRERTTAVDIAALRSKRQGAFGAQEEGLLRALMPHLQRAVQIHRRLAAAEVTGRSLAEAMDRLPYGVILLDERGQVLLANGAARRLLAARDGLTEQRGTLAASKRSESSALRRLVADALDASAGTAGRRLGSGGALAISRPSGARPLSLLVAPFRRREADPFGDRRPAAVVFVSDPDTRIDAPAALLASLHGLSAAEARVAAEVLEGGSLADIAERLGITRNTANTHIKRVFEKTGTRRQSDLVRLLSLGAATLARERGERDERT